MRVQVERLASLSAVEAAAWNALAGDSPFLKHEFLFALEQSGCVGDGTTWQPCYLVARDADGLAGALPLFIKYDSHGEFVFDWGWADAYERAGRNYYPKLVAAIPFTPATGQRLLLRDGLESGVAAALLDAAREHGARDRRVVAARAVSDGGRAAQRSSARASSRARAASSIGPTTVTRISTSSSRASAADKRKKAKRERRRVAEAGIVFEHLRGDEPSVGDWDAIIEFYSRTFWRRGREPYLNREFFERDRGHDAEQPRRHSRPAPGRADRNRYLLSQQHDAVRPLLGQRRGLPQPALRDLLLPRHRLLHPRRSRNVSSPARKASTKLRAASCRNPLGRAIGCATRNFTARSGHSSRARRTMSTPIWTRSASTCRIDRRHPAMRSSTREPSAAHEVPALAVRATSAPTRFHRLTKHWTSRMGCWPPAAISSPSDCSPRIDRVSSPGTRKGSRFCGGAPTRAPCSGRAVCKCRAACAAR